MSSRQNSWPKISYLLSEAGALSAVLLLFLATWKLLISFHDPNMSDLANVAMGVIEGRPRSLAFQNRLLGPWLVQGITEMGMTFEIALRRFHMVMLFLLFFLLYFLMRNVGMVAAWSLGLLSAFALSFLSLQFYWYHTWDILDLIVFSIFSWGVLTARTSKFFVILFFFALLNRESALFIALFVLLDAYRPRDERDIGLLSYSQISVGVVLIFFGVTLILFLRNFLYVGSPTDANFVEGALKGNEFHLVSNIWNLFIGNFTSINAMYSIFVLISFGYFFASWRSLSAAGIKLLLVAVAIMANVMIFGILIETRMLLILLPFFVFLLIDAKRCGRGEKASV